jgi:hypothetical protein
MESLRRNVCALSCTQKEAPTWNTVLSFAPNLNGVSQVHIVEHQKGPNILMSVLYFHDFECVLGCLQVDVKTIQLAEGPSTTWEVFTPHVCDRSDRAMSMVYPPNRKDHKCEALGGFAAHETNLEKLQITI